MNKILIPGFFVFTFSISAADVPGNATAIAPQRDDATSYAITERGPHSRVWQKTTYESGPDGQQIPIVRGYTELATGMHYKDANGQWLESAEEIELLPNGTGAAATKGQHKAIFPPDLYNGQIELNTPDGKWLRSQVLGLSYFDTASGQSVLIAEAKSSTGQLASSNIVLYPDAFTDFSADVRYTYTRAGFEQDIILRQQPPSPKEYGLNPETTRLQVLTEFFSPPAPKKKIRNQKGLRDEALDFGAMKIGQGKAFALGDEPANDVRNRHKSVSVSKQWSKLEGRDFLVEEVPFKKVEQKLETLPTASLATIRKPGLPGSILHQVIAGRALPKSRITKVSANMFQVAKAYADNRPGYVLDYVTFGYSSDFTFRGDTTYYVSGEVKLFDATTLEGGTVIKYDGNGLITLDDGDGTLECKTGPYRPAIFTSKNDNSIGETISGSGGAPSYGDVGTFLHLEIPATFRYVRFSHALYPIYSTLYGNELHFWHCLFTDVNMAILAASSEISLHNVLIEQISGSGDHAMEAYGSTLLVENVTLANGQNTLIDETDTTVTSKNCILTRADLYPPAPTPFQAIGAGKYYLAAGSTNRNAGTTNITPELLAELRQKTTYPPVLLSNITVTTDTILKPQAQRDTDTLDIGYHYDPIDYLCSVYVITNATLTITNGTTIAYDNSGAGIWLRGATIESIGTPLSPNWLVSFSTVQEQSIALGGAPASSRSVFPNTGSQFSRGSYKFTRFSTMTGLGYQLFHDVSSGYTNLLVQDCEIWSGRNTLKSGFTRNVILKNNLFWRSTIDSEIGTLGGTVSYSNNLFFGSSSIRIRKTITAGTMLAFNNAFDSCLFTNSTCTNGFNAYINCGTNRLNLNVGGDVTLSNFVYDAGPLGNFYQGSTNLLNQGTNTADQVGLYHYTTTTNQVRETTSRVDIGYHYVALTNGVPFDADADGSPDYLEDTNGNGSADSGETDWQTYNSPNGLNGTTKLKIYTPLKY